MKLRCDYIIKSIEGKNVLIPIGSDVISMSKLITVNNSALVILEYLKEEISFSDLLNKLIEKFDDVEVDTLKEDVTEFLNILKENSLL